MGADALKVPSEFEEELCWAANCELGWLARRRCGNSLAGEIPEPSGHNLVLCALE